jgi:hypothetical protein
MMSAMRLVFMRRDTAILQVKGWLTGISPMVWRRVLVPASFTLRELHGVIQVTMGWEGIHLYDIQSSMTTSDSPSASAFTSAERDYIRRELDQFFSTFPSVAEGFQNHSLNFCATPTIQRSRPGNEGCVWRAVRTVNVSPSIEKNRS